MSNRPDDDRIRRLLDVGRTLVAELDPEAVLDEVHDDGFGFDPGARTAGFGLAGMNERVYLAGGSLELTSGSTGTLLRAQLPLRPST
jgi:signal transduction histidine kinase